MNREQRRLLGGIWNQNEPPAGQQAATPQQPTGDYPVHPQPWPLQAEPNPNDYRQAWHPPLLRFDQLDTSAWQEEHIKKALAEADQKKNKMPSRLESPNTKLTLAERIYGEDEKKSGPGYPSRSDYTGSLDQITRNFLQGMMTRSPVINKLKKETEQSDKLESWNKILGHLDNNTLLYREGASLRRSANDGFLRGGPKIDPGPFKPTMGVRSPIENRRKTPSLLSGTTPDEWRSGLGKTFPRMTSKELLTGLSSMGGSLL